MKACINLHTLCSAFPFLFYFPAFHFPDRTQHTSVSHPCAYLASPVYHALINDSIQLPWQLSWAVRTANTQTWANGLHCIWISCTGAHYKYPEVGTVGGGGGQWWQGYTSFGTPVQKSKNDMFMKRKLYHFQSFKTQNLELNNFH